MKQFDFSKTETYLNEVVSVEQLKDSLARHCLTLGEFITEDNCLVIGELLVTCRTCYELLDTINGKTA